MTTITERLYDDVTYRRDVHASTGKMVAKRIATLIPLALIGVVGLVETVVRSIFILLSGKSFFSDVELKSAFGATVNAFLDVLWRNFTASFPPPPPPSGPLRPSFRDFSPEIRLAFRPVREFPFAEASYVAPAPPPLIPFAPNERIQDFIRKAQLPREASYMTPDDALAWQTQFQFITHPDYPLSDEETLEQGKKILTTVVTNHLNSELHAQFIEGNIVVAPKIIFVTLLYCLNNGYRVDHFPPVFLKPETMKAVYALQNKYVGMTFFRGKNYGDVVNMNIESISDSREKDIFQTLWGIVALEGKNSPFLRRCWPELIFIHTP